MKISFVKLNVLVMVFLLVGLSSPRLCESAGPIPWVDINSDGTASGWGVVVKGPYLFLYIDGAGVNYKLVNGNFLIPLELYEGLVVEVSGIFQESNSQHENGSIIVNNLRFPSRTGDFYDTTQARKVRSKLDQDPEVKTAHDIIQTLQTQVKADLNLLSEFEGKRRGSGLGLSGQVGLLTLMAAPIIGYVAGVTVGVSLFSGGVTGAAVGGALFSGFFLAERGVEGPNGLVTGEDAFLQVFANNVMKISGALESTILSDEESKTLKNIIKSAGIKMNKQPDEIDRLENRILDALDILYFLRNPIIKRLGLYVEENSWENNCLFDPFGPAKATFYFDAHTKLIAKRIELSLIELKLWDMRRDLLELKLARAAK